MRRDKIVFPRSENFGHLTEVGEVLALVFFAGKFSLTIFLYPKTFRMALMGIHFSFTLFKYLFVNIS